MNVQKKVRVSDFLYGVLLSFFFYSLSFSFSAIFFSELKNPNLALDFVFLTSMASVTSYLLLEVFVFSRTRSSSFSIGYFGTTVLGAALVFFITNIIPIDYLFDANAIVSANYLRLACLRFSLTNAALLVLRLGYEVVKYVKAVFGEAG